MRCWWRNSGVTPIKSWSNIWYQLSWRRSAFLAVHAQGKGLCSFQQGRMLKPSLFFVKNYNNPSPCACTRSCISNIWPIFEGVTTLWRKVATHWPSNQWHVERGGESLTPWLCSYYRNKVIPKCYGGYRFVRLLLCKKCSLGRDTHCMKIAV